MNNNLNMIEISEGYLNCNDPHCSDISHKKLIEFIFNSIIKSCIKSSNNVNIPIVRHNVQRVPG